MSSDTGAGRSDALLGLVAAIPLVASAASVAAHGWLPAGDEAAIGVRSWDMLAGRAVSLGQFTQATAQGGHAVFDPGPTSYGWLAWPSHLAPRSGMVVAAAVLAAVVAVVACVAAGDAGGRRGAVLTGGAFVLLTWSCFHQLAGDGTWNPYLPLLPFVGVIALSWATACGRLRYWPVAVVVATLCMQTHLMYAPASVLLLGFALVAGLASTDRAAGRWWWPLPCGVVVAVLLWAAPLHQELTGHPGNLTLLWRETLGRSEPTVGWSTGIRQFGSAVALHHPWWLRVPRTEAFHSSVGGAVVWTIGALAALLGCVFLGWRRQRRALAALAVIALLVDLGAMWAVAGVTLRSGATLVYIQFVLWPAALLTTIVAAWGLIELSSSVASRSTAHRPLLDRVGLGAVASAAVALTIWGVLEAPSAARLTSGGRLVRVRHTVDEVVHLEPKIPHTGRRLAVTVPGSDAGNEVLMAIVYQLRVSHHDPTVPSPVWQPQLGSRYRAGLHDDRLVVAATPPASDAQHLGAITLHGPHGDEHDQLWWVAGSPS